jgi:hypothetical protein
VSNCVADYVTPVPRCPGGPVRVSVRPEVSSSPSLRAIASSSWTMVASSRASHTRAWSSHNQSAAALSS